MINGVLQDAGWKFTFSAGGGGNKELQLYDDSCIHPMKNGIYIEPRIEQGILVNRAYDLRSKGAVCEFGEGDSDCVGKRYRLRWWEASCNKDKYQPVFKDGVITGGRINCPVTSSKISSSGLGYGLTSVDFLPPQGDFLWPAIWMMPERTCSWLVGGEIDLMETMGNGRHDGNGKGKFQLFNDASGLCESSALHFGVDSIGLNFFPTMWSPIMETLDLVDDAHPTRSSRQLAQKGGKHHRVSVLRTEDNLQIVFSDALASDEEPGSIRLDVDQIVRQSATSYDTKQELFEKITKTHLAENSEERLQQIRAEPYPESDRRLMRELCSTYGYRAGEHMKDKQGWSEATMRELQTSPIVSTYVLYVIGIYGIGRAVLPLNWFQQGRACASHAAPFDAKFRMQANTAIGGNFFTGNMNAKMGDETSRVRSELPWTPESMLWADDPCFPAGELNANGKLDEAQKRMVLKQVPGEAFLLRYKEWLPSWLASESDLSRVDIHKVMDGGDEVLSCVTPALGEQTRFLLYGVRHVEL
jgi:hypothetical protein